MGHMLTAASRGSRTAYRAGCNARSSTQDGSSFDPLTPLAPAAPGRPLRRHPSGLAGAFAVATPVATEPGLSRGTAGERRGDVGAAGATLDGPESHRGMIARATRGSEATRGLPEPRSVDSRKGRRGSEATSGGPSASQAQQPARAVRTAPSKLGSGAKRSCLKSLPTDPHAQKSTAHTSRGTVVAGVRIVTRAGVDGTLQGSNPTSLRSPHPRQVPAAQAGGGCTRSNRGETVGETASCSGRDLQVHPWYAQGTN